MPGPCGRSKTTISPSNPDKAHRGHLRKQFEKKGLRYLGSKLRNGALMIFERPDGEEVRVLSYVVNKKNRFGQCSFTIGHLDDRSIGWVVLVAWPFRTYYLKKMSEIQTRFTNEKEGVLPTQANLTIREGTPKADRFEHRVLELVRGESKR